MAKKKTTTTTTTTAETATATTENKNIINENIRLVMITDDNDSADLNTTTTATTTISSPQTNATIIKRGRKPRGGKIISNKKQQENDEEIIPNIILHLKCSFLDLKNYNDNLNKLVINPLEYNPTLPPVVLSFEDNNNNFYKFDSLADENVKDPRVPSSHSSLSKFSYDDYAVSGKCYKDDFVPSNNSNINSNLLTTEYKSSLIIDNNSANSMCKFCLCNKNNIITNVITNNSLSLVPVPENTDNKIYNANIILNNSAMPKYAEKNINMQQQPQNESYNDDDILLKDINTKLKKLKINLYKNQNIDKKSACFWCSFDFDTPVCYIPKYEIDNKLYGYGSFCRPECAVAYLMKEQIDDSTKFERYHLLNQVYSKVYDFKKNIKPAPNPYFLLDKYYGNLTIQEYRKLLKSEHLLLVIDKPMTRILPELHEDNEEINIFSSSSGSTSLLNNVIKKPLTTSDGDNFIELDKKTNNKTGYRVKRNTDNQEVPQKKSAILKEKFGLF